MQTAYCVRGSCVIPGRVHHRRRRARNPLAIHLARIPLVKVGWIILHAGWLDTRAAHGVSGGFVQTAYCVRGSFGHCWPRAV